MSAPGPRKAEPRGGKALVVFYRERELLPQGGGFVLCYDADEHLKAHIQVGGGTSDGGFATDQGGIDYNSAAVREPGVYVGRLKFEEGGEFVVQLYDVRPATAEEWKAHLDGEWPWEDKFAP